MRRGECAGGGEPGRPSAQRITLPGVARRVLLATGEGVTVMRDRIELPAETAAIVAL